MFKALRDYITELFLEPSPIVDNRTLATAIFYKRFAKEPPGIYTPYGDPFITYHAVRYSFHFLN